MIEKFIYFELVVKLIYKTGFSPSTLFFHLSTNSCIYLSIKPVMSIVKIDFDVHEH